MVAGKLPRQVAGIKTKVVQLLMVVITMLSRLAVIMVDNEEDNLHNKEVTAHKGVVIKAGVIAAIIRNQVRRLRAEDLVMEIQVAIMVAQAVVVDFMAEAVAVVAVVCVT